MLRRALFATFALLVACGSPTGTKGAVAGKSGDFLNIVEAPPYPPLDGAGAVAIEQTLERRRWLFEERTETRELPLLRRIKREQMGNFGGVEWRWRDGAGNGGLGELTGAVYFLREPAKTLARYTVSPLFRPAQAGFARSDQDRVVRRWAETIGRDVASEGFANMQVPTINVALPRAEFEQRARAERWRLPANLKIRFDPRAEPDLPAVSEELRPLIRAFPQQPRLTGPTPDIATFDAVVLRGGCFLIDLAGEDDPLVEFPFTVGLYRDAQGHVAFRYRSTSDRRRLGRVGTRLQLGSRGERPAPPDLASACGAKRIVTVTSVNQAAGYGSAALAVEPLRSRLGLSTAQAMRRANGCLLADERTMADNRLRGGRDQPNACAKLGLYHHVNPPPPRTPPVRAERPRQPELAAARPLKRMEPARNGVCRFEERDPADRPRELIQTNFHSNMIFWADRGAVLWDHPNGFIDEGMVIPGKRIVAARQGMKDLWISPARDADIMLYSGPDRFECVIRQEPIE